MTTSAAHHNVPTEIKGESEFENTAAKGISYFTPEQSPPAGTAYVPDGKKPSDLPKLFQPLKIRGLTLQNRIIVSPMCQYSAQDGHVTDWHVTHLGGIIQRGPGLTCVEASAVQANGRITPEDVGIWKDSQIAPLARIVEFAHGQNQKIMIQLGHAGRKASTFPPWISGGAVAYKDQNGWPDDVVAPSAIPWNEDHAKPRAMSLQDIEDFKKAYGDATRRSLKAGFDAIEIHAAHGYLLTSFLSPVSNKRTDQYGGSFENRTRLAVELVDIVRSIIPEDMPLFLRISGSEWLTEGDNARDFPESWTTEDTARLAPILAEHGVDLLDVSSGGNHPRQHPHAGPAYQAPFAFDTKKVVGDKLLVGSVGNITGGKQAEELLQKGLDAVFVARPFQKNPGLVWTWADEIGVTIRNANQIRWGFEGRGKQASKVGKPVLEFPEYAGARA